MHSILLYLIGKGRKLMKILSGIQRVKSFMKYFIFCGMIFTHIQYKIDGEKVETVTEFIFVGSKITADGHCSHEIKRHVLLVT